MSSLVSLLPSLPASQLGTLQPRYFTSEKTGGSEGKDISMKTHGDGASETGFKPGAYTTPGTEKAFPLLQLPWVLDGPGWWGQGRACGAPPPPARSGECNGQTEKSGVSEITCSGQQLRRRGGDGPERGSPEERAWPPPSLHWGSGRATADGGGLQDCDFQSHFPAWSSPSLGGTGGPPNGHLEPHPKDGKF